MDQVRSEGQSSNSRITSLTQLVETVYETLSKAGHEVKKITYLWEGKKAILFTVGRTFVLKFSREPFYSAKKHVPEWDHGWAETFDQSQYAFVSAEYPNLVYVWYSKEAMEIPYAVTSEEFEQLKKPFTDQVGDKKYAVPINKMHGLNEEYTKSLYA